jgi:hypothetical protein
MKLTIAKLEGGFAVCNKENQTLVFVNRRDLPINAKEGDVLVVGDNNIEIEAATTV